MGGHFLLARYLCNPTPETLKPPFKCGSLVTCSPTAVGLFVPASRPLILRGTDVNYHQHIRYSTRWSTTLSSKVELPHAIDLGGKCGANLVTLRLCVCPNETLALRGVRGFRWRCIRVVCTSTETVPRKALRGGILTPFLEPSPRFGGKLSPKNDKPAGDLFLKYPHKVPGMALSRTW